MSAKAKVQRRAAVKNYDWNRGAGPVSRYLMARGAGRSSRTAARYAYDNMRGGRMAAPYVASDELRVVDIPSGNIVCAPTPIGVPLNLVQSGTSIWNRDGNVIRLKSLKIRGYWFNTATSAQAVGRMVIVYDAQNNGGIPAWTDIMASVSQAGALSTTGQSEPNIMQRDRFKIVRDIHLILPPVTNTAGVMTNESFILDPNSNFSIDEYIRLGNLPTFFTTNSAPAVIGDINKGGLFMFVFGPAQWSVQLGTRVRFYK